MHDVIQYLTFTPHAAYLPEPLGLGEEVVDVGRVRRKASRPSVSELKPSGAEIFGWSRHLLVILDII